MKNKGAKEYVLDVLGQTIILLGLLCLAFAFWLGLFALLYYIIP